MTHHALSAVLIAASLMSPEHIAAQALSPSRAGPIIDHFGAVYTIPSVDYATPTDHVYKVVFEVAAAPDAVAEVNPSINTLARFLNMHARAGVPRENMQLALVLHGTAGKNALRNDVFRERYGTDNPDLPLIKALHEAGVQIYLCGQTAWHRGLPPEDLAEPVQLALSAMTVLVTLQDDGYQLVTF